MKRTLSTSRLLVLLLATSCGAGQTRVGSVFSKEWEDDGGKSIAALQQRLSTVKIPRAADVAVGITEQGLVGVPLEGGARWTFAHALDGRPSVVGSVVVGKGGGELFALDARTGKQLWTRRAGGVLRGAGDDGRTTVLSLGTTGDNATTVLAVTHDGSVVRQLEVGPVVGIPAVVGNDAFLPWDNQYVTVYDLATGEEAARVVLREESSRAFTENGQLYFGEVGLFRFDDHIGKASAGKASHIALPERELPGSPKWFASGIEPLPKIADARDKIALLARPSTEEGELGLDSNRFAAIYFKIVAGFDGRTGALAWVHTHKSDVIGGAAFVGGTAVCDADGKVTFLGAKSGAVLGTADLGQKVSTCIVQADAFSQEDSGTAAPSLAVQIGDAISVQETEMVMIQKVLLREMARLPEEVVTKNLVELASDPRTSPLLMGEVRSALASRRNGASYMMQSLARHYDFLKDVLSPPPVGPLAEALGGMKHRPAAPLLALHLNDPADTPDDIKKAATALVLIGDEKQLPELTTFFALYRTTAEDEDVVSAVVNVAKAILQFGGAEGKSLVARGYQDPLTSVGVKQRLASMVETPPQSSNAEASTTPRAEPARSKKK